MRSRVTALGISNLCDNFMNSDSLSIRYALAFCFALTFAHRNFCAFAIFRRAGSAH
jgi:hypothetical protein